MMRNKKKLVTIVLTLVVLYFAALVFLYVASRPAYRVTMVSRQWDLPRTESVAVMAEAQKNAPDKAP